MQKKLSSILVTTLFFLGFNLGIPEAVFGQSESFRVDRKYCLTYLLEPDTDLLVRESRRVEAVLEDSRGLSKDQERKLRYAAGVLRVYRYIRTEERDDAMTAKEMLEAVEEEFAESDLFMVHIGMAHAFVASIKTIFGVGDLKKMQAELQSIDRDHPDWLIRFLRGTTLVEVGRALPGVFTIKEIKQEAVEVGSGDLRYVLSMDRGNTFDPENYDPNNTAVPPSVLRKAEEVLEAE